MWHANLEYELANSVTTAADFGFKTQRIQTDVLVVGGGTAGTMAGIKAKQANPDSEVLILEKANIRRSGAIAMGMDGVNTAVIPGNSTPEQYVREITIANDGIVNQKPSTKPGDWALR